jgi:hypothetical protein
MKTGTENRKMLVFAVLAALLALASVVRMFVVLQQQPAAAAPPTAPAANTAERAPQARRVRRAVQGRLAPGNSLDPTLRLDLLKQSEATEYRGSGRNIFAKYVPPPPPPPQDPRLDHRGPRCPGDPACPPPPPPPIPLTFYGFASRPGEPKKVFLSLKDTGDVFIAAEGEVVNRRYRVLHIGTNSVEIEDVLSNNRQTIPLTQG